MITPRHDEVNTVAATIESGDFDDAHQLAKALIKQVAEIVQHRDGKDGVGLHLVVLEGALFGPFYNAGDAERWKDEAYAQLRLQGRVLRLWAPTTYSLVEKHEARTARCVCGHAKEQHREKKKGQNVQHAECGVWSKRDRQWCACAAYAREIR